MKKHEKALQFINSIDPELHSLIAYGEKGLRQTLAREPLTDVNHESCNDLHQSADLIIKIMQNHGYPIDDAEISGIYEYLRLHKLVDYMISKMKIFDTKKIVKSYLQRKKKNKWKDVDFRFGCK